MRKRQQDAGAVERGRPRCHRCGRRPEAHAGIWRDGFCPHCQTAMSVEHKKRAAKAATQACKLCGGHSSPLTDGICIYCYELVATATKMTPLRDNTPVAPDPLAELAAKVEAMHQELSELGRLLMTELEELKKT